MPDLPEVLTRALTDKEVFTPSGGKTALHSNISEEECNMLYETVRNIRPAMSLEIGFAQGISALAILKALEDNGAGHHHIIDPFQSRFENCGLVMVERAGLGGKMTFHEKFAGEVIPSLPLLQFTFIDSSHLFDHTISEFVLTDKRLDVGGIIGLHDMWMPAQQAAVRYILANRAYVLHETGVQVSRTNGGALKKGLRNLAARLPRAERIFSPEFLKPWADFQTSNLVLLRKTGEDDRDWRYHVRF